MMKMTQDSNTEMQNLRKSYKLYAGSVEQPVNIKIYLDIVHGFLKFLMQKIVAGTWVKLPCRLGIKYIKGRKVIPKLSEEGEIKGLAPDWQKTIELWNGCEECKKRKDKIYHFNEHTNGVMYKIFWSKKDVLIENKLLYSFIPTRENKRNVPVSIEEGGEYFVKE